MTIEAPLDEDLRVVRILSGQVKTHFWILGVLAVCVCVCVVPLLPLPVFLRFHVSSVSLFSVV